MFTKLTETFIAAFLLALFFVLSLASIWNNSATTDESVHLPAGYSYLTRKDMRLNPEHPPLLKDLAAVPLLFMNIKFPKDDPSWTQNVNDQWTFGPKFLYESGNDADNVIFWSRIPPLLLTTFLGFFLFLWTRLLFGGNAALLALTLFAFSPTILAHGSLVTTDLTAAAGILFAIASFLRFLKNPTLNNLILAGFVLGIALLMKFSTVLVIPFFLALAAVWILVNPVRSNARIFSKHYTTGGLLNNSSPELKKTSNGVNKAPLLQTFAKLFLIVVIGFVGVVWPLYQYHVWNYPPERQARDTQELLKTFGGITQQTCFEGRVKKCPAELTIWMADKPGLRPFAQYFLGFLMVAQRSVGGNTTFFLGDVSNQAWTLYFPIVYAIKESLAFHLLTIIALLFTARKIKQPFWQQPFKRLSAWIQNHFTEFALLGFIVFYWFMSVRANLNIGIRHLMPILPLMYILVSNQVSQWINVLRLNLKTLTITVLIAWHIIGTLAAFPHFLAYFNELAAGPDWQYITDSNLDWGQDMKRLAKFAEERDIKKISIDYFGGGSPKYYLGDKYEPWWSAKGKPRGWFAVSATFRQGAWGQTTKGFTVKPEDAYSWLRPYEPVTVIGRSIFVYYFP